MKNHEYLVRASSIGDLMTKGSASSMKEQLELIRDYLTQKTEQ